MEFLKKIKEHKWSDILKIAGVVILVIVVAVFALSLVSSVLFGNSGVVSMVAPQAAPLYDYDYKLESSGGGYGGEDMVGLSVRNAVSAPASSEESMIRKNTSSTGDTAENFEITEYNASIETRNLSETCAIVSGLKAREDVIFENSNEYDRGCNYYFKVKRASAPGVLDIIKGLDPKDLSESIYTIKKLVDDYTSETEILEKKLASINETFEGATRAYDNITVLATRVQDVESLAKIIDSKINTLERLTQEKINISAQLERIARAKATQLDRLEYTFFRINITEDKFVDGENLKDSWKYAVKEFVSDINEIAQSITINLISFLSLIVETAVYFLVLLVVAKYGWKATKKIWNK